MFFKKDNTVEDFMCYLQHIHSKFTQVICIAHNARSFDAQFILKSVILNPEIKTPRIIMNGSQIFAIYFQRCNFSDSLNYFNCSLAKLPEMFTIENSV
jgi:hypothetical protein